MDSVTFHVNGNPAPKGSFTRMPNGAMLPAGTTASRKKVANWRNDIRYAAIEAMGDTPPSRGAIRLMVEFQLPYPVSSIRKYQMGWWPHTKQPDVDKLLRMMLDALTGIVWADDSQVNFAHCNKVYAWNDKPGAHVVIDFLTDDFMQELAIRQRNVTNVLDSL
jgi:crossover junction endodeoxyribonuclease RusA